MIHRTQTAPLKKPAISNLLFKVSQPAVQLVPDFLLQLSIHSMEKLPFAELHVGDSENTSEQFESEFEYEDLELNTGAPTPEMIPRVNAQERREVAAVDVSSIKIGETESGLLCALRGALTWRATDRYCFVRCGPLAFHISRDSQLQLQRLRAQSLDMTDPSFALSPLNLLARLRISLERSLQDLACKSFRNAIILLDGSLTAGTPDNPTRQVKTILETARHRRNIIIAFSKGSRIRVSGKRITSIANDYPAPSFIDIDDETRQQFPRTPVTLLGRVYVVKLQDPGFSFRADIDRQNPKEEDVKRFGELLGSDLHDQGYPETLRLAHILSTFTANDVLGIQRAIAHSYGIRILPRLALRRCLFGPFGSAWEAS